MQLPQVEGADGSAGREALKAKLPAPSLGGSGAVACPMDPVGSYCLDTAQRWILWLDVLRQRGNNAQEYSARAAPHALSFEAELILDGRSLERPAKLEATNVYLRETHAPAHNARFGNEAAEPGTAFIAYTGMALDDVLCVQEDRVVGRDNCVSWSGHSLQIPTQRHRRHYVNATACVHEYPYGRLANFDSPRCLARYDANGVLTDEPTPPAIGWSARLSRGWRRTSPPSRTLRAASGDGLAEERGHP